MVNSANRSGAPHQLNYTGFMQGWMWGGDDQTGQWYPQGITTSADYQETGLYNGRFIMLASWYDHSDEVAGKGARISFVNMTDPANPRYRHVLLVEPYVQQYNPAVTVPTFRAIHTHAGGIMWYGKLLYVADTFNGIRVFDTTKMLKVSATGDGTTIGLQSDGTYTAHNYQYVLPQVAAYDDVATPSGIPRVRYSCIALDRSTAPDSMVVAEYGEPDKPANQKRLFRFNLDYTDRLLSTGTASKAYQIDINEVNGAASVNGKYYIARANGDNPGDLITWVPGNFVNYNDEPSHPQDLSYDKNTGWLWNMTEKPAGRYVFARAISKLL